MFVWIKDTLIVFIALLAPLWIVAGLNYSGFCWEQKRWLSDEEKIRLMVAEANGRDSSTVKDVANNSLGTPVKRIPYKDTDDFLAKNPNCCKVGIQYSGEHSGDGIYNPFSLFYLLFYGGDVVSLYYQENYYDKSGEQQSQMVNWLYGVSNCGKNLN